jgi:hypothetical protein
VLSELVHAVEAQGDAVTVRTPVPVPFLRIDYYARGYRHGGADFTQYYAPKAARIALQMEPGAWTWVDAGRLRPLLERITAGVAPFGKPIVTRVLVGGRAVRDPGSYVRLFSLRTTTNDYPDDGDWVTVRIETAGGSPWSTDAATLEYSPGKDVLWRGAEFLKVPSALASALETRASPADVSADGSFPWAAVASGMGAAAVVLPAVWLVRRRRRP